MVVAVIALFVALGGTSYAVIKLPAGSVGSREIKSNAVTGAKIRPSAVTRSDLAPSARTGARGSRGPVGPAGPAGESGVVGAPEPWKPLPFSPNWTNWGDIHVTCAYRKDQLGKVHLRGLATQRLDGTQVVGTLPPGYRPPGRVVFSVVMNSGTVETGRVNVDSDGTIVRSTPSANEPDYTSLDSISFWTD